MMYADSIRYERKLCVNSTRQGNFHFDNEADDVFVLQNGF